MADDSLARPSFFEGQYLGSDDLRALLEYGRTTLRRHALGVQPWGIVTGLSLQTREASDGGFEVYLMPGLAYDGYGRQIVVASPQQIAESLCADCPSGSIEVWIRYDETERESVRAGFETCDCSDGYVRAYESYAIEVGARSSISDRQSGVTIGGVTIEDAREMRRAFEEDGPLVCDASAPHQTFPTNDAAAIWLIPLGLVKWAAGNPGHFEELSDDQLLRSRTLRRYVGLVGENLYAADGVLRLRRRETLPDEGQSNDDACAETALESADLAAEEGKVQPTDLVWVEGNLRVEGDARLFGGALDLRDAEGLDNGAPLRIERNEGNDEGGKDLALVIGSGTTGLNRLVIGPLDNEADPPAVREALVVLDSGRVGIGEPQPDRPLEIRGQKSGNADELIGLRDAAGALRWHVNLHTADQGQGLNFAGPAGSGHLFLLDDGSVGVGTMAPRARLHVVGGSDVTLDDDSGSFLIGRVAGSNLAMDGNEIQARKAGEPSALRLQREGGALQIHPGLAQSQRVEITGDGDVGIGTSSPDDKLDVRGNIRFGSAGDLYALGALANMRVVAGRVGADGTIVGGTGFGVESHAPGSGAYVIRFTSGFNGSPFVIVSLVDAINKDNIATLTNIGSNRFTVNTFDVTGTDTPAAQDTEFMFVAIGLR